MSDSATIEIPAILNSDSIVRVWHSVAVRTAREAEEALDQAEKHGYLEQELVFLERGKFLVRWR